MNMTSPVQPHLTVLSPEQIAQVHAYSLDILARVGLRVDSPQAAAVLGKSDGVKFLSPDHAVFQPELVEWAIRSAPSSIEIFSRTGEPVFHLGADRTRFGAGVTN
jgi:trimethylamine--corrinoid protein Co-methyltransferase